MKSSRLVIAVSLILAALVIVLLLATPAGAAPRLPTCTPYQREHWRVTDRNTQIEGRTLLIHTSPDGSKRCAEVQVSTQRPQAPKKVRK